MDFPIETATFFYVVLSGFMAVWTFRYFTNRKEKYSEFEWFGLSVFWGLAILGVFGMAPEASKTEILENPLTTGFLLSFFGIFFGYSLSRFSRLGWLSAISRFFGKDGRDKSRDIF